LRHGLLLYDDDETLAAKMAPFLQEGLEQGDAEVLILDRHKRDLLLDHLGVSANDIVCVDRDSFYARPLDALARYDARLRQLVRDGADTARVFAELPRCSPSDDIDSWISYEAIVNRALAHHPLWVVCGYDSRELPAPLMESALDTHPEVLRQDWERNHRFRSPEAVVTRHTHRPRPVADLHPLPLEAGRRAFCDQLSEELRLAGVGESEASDMVLAVGEVLANAHQHGGERVAASAGHVDHRFVCEVFDSGPGIDDPCAGYVPPRPETSDGAGLWVARQLTRALEFLRSPEGFRVRLWADATQE
jgi:anti-sigma regulatory factor (Ser/Thr protein kinase)